MKQESYVERMDDINGSSPRSVSSNQGLDLSPLPSQRASPMVPSASGSPTRRSEDQLTVPVPSDGKYLYNSSPLVPDSYRSSPVVTENKDSANNSEMETPSISASSEVMDSQDEVPLNMSVMKKEEQEQVDENSGNLLRVTPSQESLDLRRSPIEQSEMNISYLHRNNLMAVSHSMS